MKFTKKLGLGLVYFLGSWMFVQAQEVNIKLGNSEVALNQYYTITIEVKNDRLKGYTDFPQIEGFVKRGTSSSTSTNYINGRMSSTQSLTQNYQATDQGDFLLQPFSMTINGEEVRSQGMRIKVGEPIQRQSNRRSRDPFSDFFGRSRNEPPEYVDVKADAFAALNVDKSEVYVGEGFTATLSFFVAEANIADMRFYDLSNQLNEIVKTVKPSNCWEENFSIDQIVGDPVTINGRNYTRYKIYQTVYYPLTQQDIDFPSVGLKMIKFKIAKNPTFFGRNRQEDYETFYSKPKSVKVRELPPHPLRDVVAVGNYRLEEKLNIDNLETGQSFNYDFNVRGEGNISAIEAPDPTGAPEFDFYAPNIRQNVTRSNGRVRGAKGFSFYGIPNEPGEYDLGDYFSWVYFNPAEEAYDTLRSELALKVTGESRQNLTIASNDLGDFYDRIHKADNSLVSLKGSAWFTIFVNILVVLILCLTAFMLFRKAA